MGTQNSSAELWPADAAPRHWVAALFEKMSRMWGNRFLDTWRDTDLEGVMVEWGRGLRKLSQSELKAGVDSLITLKFPPSLPEFYGLCKQMRLHDVSTAEALTDQTRAHKNVVAANMTRIREIMVPLMRPREATAEWAYKLLMLGTQKNGKPLTHEGIRCASDAISSKAGLMVIENCTDEALRAEYEIIRNEIVGAYRAAGKPLWETP